MNMISQSMKRYNRDRLQQIISKNSPRTKIKASTSVKTHLLHTNTLPIKIRTLALVQVIYQSLIAKEHKRYFTPCQKTNLRAKQRRAVAVLSHPMYN